MSILLIDAGELEKELERQQRIHYGEAAVQKGLWLAIAAIGKARKFEVEMTVKKVEVNG